MILTLMVLALVTALATTVAVVTINNLQSSRRAEQAGLALNAAEAGVAQALSYMRANGVRDLKCRDDGASCSGVWGSANPVSDTLGHVNSSYEVWIEEVTAFSPQTQTTGIYEIHSTGRAGAESERRVLAKIEVETTQVPRGIFAKSISSSGSAAIRNTSVFTSGCVPWRGKFNVSGTDPAYGIPAGVHSSSVITTAKNCSDASTSIHQSSPCNTDYPYDQDRRGSSLQSTTCRNATTMPDKYYGLAESADDPVFGSFVRDKAGLMETFGVKDPSLSQAQLDQLRSTAEIQGSLFATADGWKNKTINNSHSVLYFDLTNAPSNRRVVHLDDIPRFHRSEGDACITESVIVVVEEGNVNLNSNKDVSASVFLVSQGTYGKVVKANGNVDFLGTLYAESIDLTGNVDVLMDACFLENISPSLLDIDVVSYLEDDREN